jgi:hypothetical protein
MHALGDLLVLKQLGIVEEYANEFEALQFQVEMQLWLCCHVLNFTFCEGAPTRDQFCGPISSSCHHGAGCDVG